VSNAGLTSLWLAGFPVELFSCELGRPFEKRCPDAERGRPGRVVDEVANKSFDAGAFEHEDDGVLHEEDGVPPKAAQTASGPPTCPFWGRTSPARRERPAVLGDPASCLFDQPGGFLDIRFQAGRRPSVPADEKVIAGEDRQRPEDLMARVFITGSADGLGRAAAQTLLAGGHEVVVHARNSDRLAAVRDLMDRGAAAVVGDLSDLEETRAIARDMSG
jgi:short chain dehydrogenase